MTRTPEASKTVTSRSLQLKSNEKRTICSIITAREISTPYCYYDCFRKRPFKQLFANTYRVNNHGQFVNNEYISILLKFHIAQRTSWRWEHLEVAHWNHVKLSLMRQAGAVDSLAVWMFKNTFITKLQL